jgi:hypothetical protein
MTYHEPIIDRIEGFISERIEPVLDLGYDDWYRSKLTLVEDDERDPLPSCGSCKRGRHHECYGRCGCTCNAEEDDDGR